MRELISGAFISSERNSILHWKDLPRFCTENETVSIRKQFHFPCKCFPIKFTLYLGENPVYLNAEHWIIKNDVFLRHLTKIIYFWRKETENILQNLLTSADYLPSFNSEEFPSEKAVWKVPQADNRLPLPTPWWNHILQTSKKKIANFLFGIPSTASSKWSSINLRYWTDLVEEEGFTKTSRKEF